MGEEVDPLDAFMNDLNQSAPTKADPLSNRSAVKQSNQQYPSDDEVKFGQD
jgi:hypothetical protein